jgi:glucose/mannose transport system substrate-binding protein
MAIGSAAQASMRSAVSEFWNNDKMSVSEVIAKLTAVNSSKQK